MRDLFNLQVPPERRRGDIDAHLEMDGITQPLDFELKSTTGRNISTVRDLGPDHIAKWRHLHWLFGFYDTRGEEPLHFIYASPADMRPWVDEKEAYIRPDLVLAEKVPALVTDAVLTEIVGDQQVFTAAEARSIMKMQWSAEDYADNGDMLGNLYSRSRLLHVVQQRCAYVIRRGATLNNPHVSANFFAGFELITRDHAVTLRRLVRRYLDSAEAAAAAGQERPEGETDPLVRAAAEHAAHDAREEPAEPAEPTLFDPDQL